MAKRSTWNCPSCGTENSKKDILCKNCNAANERKLRSILDLEIKASNDPQNALRCKCGTILPGDVKNCPYCNMACDHSAKKISLTAGVREIKTPATRHLNLPGYKFAIPKSVKSSPEVKSPTLTTCSACGHQISVKAEACPSCGNPTGVHVCPKCQSINTKVISGASKAGSILLWGVFAANKVVSKFECKDCGHKW